MLKLIGPSVLRELAKKELVCCYVCLLKLMLLMAVEHALKEKVGKDLYTYR